MDDKVASGTCSNFAWRSQSTSLLIFSNLLHCCRSTTTKASPGPVDSTQVQTFASFVRPTSSCSKTGRPSDQLLRSSHEQKGRVPDVLLERNAASLSSAGAAGAGDATALQFGQKSHASTAARCCQPSEAMFTLERSQGSATN